MQWKACRPGVSDGTENLSGSDISCPFCYMHFAFIGSPGSFWMMADRPVDIASSLFLTVLDDVLAGRFTIDLFSFARVHNC